MPKIETREVWGIRDLATGEWYLSRCGKNGWYDRDPNHLRTYTSFERAQRTIDAGNHHVTYPNRVPEPVPVRVTAIL